MQEMTYAEREHLKHSDFGDQACHVITMIAHWHRQYVRVPFTDYAKNWVAADTQNDVSNLAKAWPMSGSRRIADGMTQWDSFGKDGSET